MRNGKARSRSATFLGSKQLDRLLHQLEPFGCLDIGARGGITGDILPLGKAAHVFGFEPDEDECEALNRELSDGNHPFGQLRYLPVALGARQEQRVLNIMRHAGASSILDPDPDVKSRFENRADYFEVARTATVDTRPLDDIIAEYAIHHAVYMKIDVEGFELEILKGAQRLLASSLLAVRSEVAISPVRIDQPDYGELAAFLKRFHFMPMGFLYLVDWRSTTREKYPIKARGALPYSRGQTIHGDALFLRDPTSLDDGSEDGIKSMIHLALIALLYDYVDFAHDIVARPSVNRFLNQHYGEHDMVAALGDVSRYLDRQQNRQRFKLWRKNLAKRIKSDIRRVMAT